MNDGNQQSNKANHGKQRSHSQLSPPVGTRTATGELQLAKASESTRLTEAKGRKLSKS
jgi:hypothetical protein